jgi:hypothetical protein
MTSIDSLKLISAVMESEGRDEAFADVEWSIRRIRELEAALGWFLADERFRVAVGGNPKVVERMLTEARAIYEDRRL